MEYLKSRLAAWHEIWIDACQDRLFQRDYRWLDKVRNLQPGDVVWMITDSKLAKKMK